MLKVLLKKQLMEVFRAYFYDAKKNKGRTKASTIAWFAFFAVVMVGVLGGMFTSMAVGLCAPLAEQGVSWLYFCIMGLLSILLGAFGSAFSTYAGLYLAKDNDLLLSMPIPVRTLIAARLMNVYLLGLVYSAVAWIPAIVVGWIQTPVTAGSVAADVVLLACISLIVLCLSCLLGWVVAKISLKLKNKSVITALIAVAFIGVYYFFYFKAQSLLQALTQNATEYGARIRGAAGALYVFGRAGAGDGKALLLVAVVVIALCAAVWLLLQKSFLRIATSTNTPLKTKARARAAKSRSVSHALLAKEMARFLSSPNYMLNCGLAILMLPVCGVLLLIKGGTIIQAIDGVFGAGSGCAAAVFCGAACMVGSMNNMAAPSVSLEGRSFWIVRSLPVTSAQVIRAKLMLQVLLTAAPMLVFAICAAIILPESIAVRLLFVLVCMTVVLLQALWAMTIGLMKPDLGWTNELAPIKQNIGVLFSIFGMWLYGLLLTGLYLAVGHFAGPAVYLGAVCIVTAALCAPLYRWLRTKGAAHFEAL